MELVLLYECYACVEGAICFQHVNNLSDWASLVILKWEDIAKDGHATQKTTMKKTERA